MAGIHLLKLCVGCESVEDLLDWQSARAAERRAAGADPRPFHVTRMWPKRGDELLDGGSLYWVVKGLVLCRQRVVALERHTGEDGIERCRLRLDGEIVRTTPQLRRAFQGWRYLRPRTRRGPRLRRRGRALRRRSPLGSPRWSRRKPSVHRRRPRCRRSHRGTGAGRVAYDWDAIGIEFCKATLGGDMAAIRPLLTNALPGRSRRPPPRAIRRCRRRGCSSRPT